MRRSAEASLRALYPDVGPWTAAALWHDLLPALPPEPQAPLSDEIDVICAQRLAGLLLRYLHLSRVEVAEEHRRALQQASFWWTQRTMRALAGSASVVRDLESRGAALAVSKGPGIARFYPSVECRPFSDIDVVTDSSEFARIVGELQDSGWYEEDRNRQPWNYFRRLCREGLNLVSATGDAAIDLHHRLPPWLWSARTDVAAMVRRSEPVTLAATTYRCLRAADNLIVAALHLVSDRNEPGRTLVIWRDVVQLARVTPPAEAVAAARSAGLEGWLAAVLDALPPDLGTEPVRDALRSPGSLPHPVRLRLLLTSRAARLGVVGTQALRLPLGNALAFVLGMAVPSPSFLRRKYPDTGRRYRRWWSNGPRRLAGDTAE